MRSEINDRKWFWGGVGLQMGTGYVVGYLVYQIGTLITEGSVGAGFVPGLIVSAVIVGIVVYMMKNSDKKLKAAALSGK